MPTVSAVGSLHASGCRGEKFQSDVFLSDRQEQHFGIAQRNSLELVGELAYFYKPGDCITLGITVAPRFQRNGYACEMLREVIRSVREKYPTLDIVALIGKASAFLKSWVFGRSATRIRLPLLFMCSLHRKSPRRKYRGLFLFRKLCYTEKNAAGEYYVNQ